MFSCDQPNRTCGKGRTIHKFDVARLKVEAEDRLRDRRKWEEFMTTSVDRLCTSTRLFMN